MGIQDTLRDMTLVLGSVKGKIETLEDAQQDAVIVMREDVRTIHHKIETSNEATRDAIDKLFKEGCARAPQHNDQENRLRDVETWKTSHDSETRALATSAGGAAGATKGAAWGGAIAATMTVISWLLEHFGAKGGTP